MMMAYCVARGETREVPMSSTVNIPPSRFTVGRRVVETLIATPLVATTIRPIERDRQLIDRDHRLIEQDRQLIDRDHRSIERDRQLADRDYRSVDRGHRPADRQLSDQDHRPADRGHRPLTDRDN